LLSAPAEDVQQAEDRRPAEHTKRAEDRKLAEHTDPTEHTNPAEDARTAKVERVELVRVSAPEGGSVHLYLQSARVVRKGEKLVDISHGADPAKVKELAARVDELTGLAAQDPVYQPFLADARNKLAAAGNVRSTEVVAPRDGKAIPRVNQGAHVHTGTLLFEIE
jgi:hypothetical protein